MQQHQEFKLAHNLVTYAWNREYCDVWKVLKSAAWGAERAGFLVAVAKALRDQVADSITAAYSVISITTACEMLGMSREELIGGVGLS